jgi:hypothetical protein
MLVVMICKSVGNTKRASNNIPWHNPEELRIGIIRMLYGAHYDIVVLMLVLKTKATTAEPGTDCTPC